MRRGPQWPVRSLLEAGADLRTIQVLLGHRKIEHTIVYLHLSRKHLTAVANPLDMIDVSSPERVKPGISIIDSGPTDNIRQTAPECNGQSSLHCSAASATTEGTLSPSLEGPTVRSRRFQERYALLFRFGPKGAFSSVA